MSLSSLGRVGPERGSDFPGQELFDAVDWMFGDGCQDRAQIKRRIDSVQLGSADKRIERCGPLPAGVGSHEEVILPADCDSTDILPISVKN